MLFFIHISIRFWRAQDATIFGGCWNGLGLFIGLMALVEFTTEILRFEGLSKAFGLIAIMYAAVNRLLLIPCWICVLGYGLDRATAKQAYGGDTDAVAGELALTEVRDTSNPANTNPFTIGDDNDDAGDLAPVAAPTPTASRAQPDLKPSPPPAAFGN